jgi:diguanylate cyclase
MKTADREIIASIAQKALLLMTKRRIAMHPENYLVWFEYFMGINKTLVDDINKILHEETDISDETSLALFRRHFGKDARIDHIEDSYREIQKILKDVLDEILFTQDFTIDFRDKLQGVTAQLEEATEPTEIQKIVSGLMHITVDAIHASEQLKTRLDETTSMSQNLQKELEKAQHEILIDPLTGLYNRKAFDRKILEYMKIYQDEGNLFSMMMMDIDHFKQFNDRHGHLLGDQVLKFMGSFLHKELKGKDFAARYGGEEFIILLAGTSADNACAFANNLRKSISGVKLRHVRTDKILGRITISIGVSAIRKGDTVESIVERADSALYMAKQNGRNNVKSELDTTAYSGTPETVVPAMVEFLKE